MRSAVTMEDRLATEREREREGEREMRGVAYRSPFSHVTDID